MAQQEGQIDIERIRADPNDIIPPLEQNNKVGEKVIQIQLTPTEKQSYLPPDNLYPIVVPASVSITPPPPEKKPLVVDIETTGSDPTKSRLICIGFLDPAEQEPKPSIILLEDEETMLRQFLNIYQQGGYNEIIGYNLKFDFSYLFVRCALYRFSGKELFDSKLTDLMGIYNQVKEAFVFGINKVKSLDSWARLLLDMRKPISFEQLLRAYQQKDYAKIIEYNENDVEMTYLLWLLKEFVLRVPIGEQAALAGGSEEQIASGEETKMVTIRCPEDLSEWEVPENQKTFICPIDGKEINVQENIIRR